MRVVTIRNLVIQLDIPDAGEALPRVFTALNTLNRELSDVNQDQAQILNINDLTVSDIEIEDPEEEKAL